MLDHCRRQRGAGQRGIKALVLYPMNALANDQARRIARAGAHAPDALGGVRAGLYIGDSGAARRDDRDRVDRRPVRLRARPAGHPAHQLQDARHAAAAAARTRRCAQERGETLRYLVLDEFHTYDGAQGTDVAMLLRRLGTALGRHHGERPLGAITPVATSATLGGGSDGRPEAAGVRGDGVRRRVRRGVAGGRGPGDASRSGRRRRASRVGRAPRPAARRVTEALRGARRTRISCRRACGCSPDENAADLDRRCWGSGCARTRSPGACCISRHSPCR